MTDSEHQDSTPPHSASDDDPGAPTLDSEVEASGEDDPTGAGSYVAVGCSVVVLVVVVLFYLIRAGLGGW